MSTYEPGTVAIATVRGVPNVRVMWRDREAGYLPGWWTARGAMYADPKSVTDVRLLVVLDWHPSPTHVQDLLVLLRENHWTSLADQIEAQTKPPRIEEPGLYGVVEAETNDAGIRRFCHLEEDSEGWSGAGNWYRWADLRDPTLVRPGIGDES